MSTALPNVTTGTVGCFTTGREVGEEEVVVVVPLVEQAASKNTHASMDIERKYVN